MPQPQPNAAGTLLHLAPTAGHQSVFRPGEHGARWLGLAVLRLATGERWQGDLGDAEAALVVMGGRCTLSLAGRESACWPGLGDRADIFAGPPAAAYAPRGSSIQVLAESDLELALIESPCSVDLAPRLILSSQVKEVSTGVANWRRDVRLVIPPGSPLSQRLIVGETVNPAGNWSGIPPHKHDRPGPGESPLEEFYWFKARPADGYAVQLLYRDAGAQAHIVGHDDVLLMLSGYHPTVAAPGTTVAYLWALAGESKTYQVAADPRFAWVPTAEAVIRERERR